MEINGRCFIIEQNVGIPDNVRRIDDIVVCLTPGQTISVMTLNESRHQHYLTDPSIIRVNFGSRLQNAQVIRQLMNGQISFDDAIYQGQM
jgi:hypothetical protein